MYKPTVGVYDIFFLTTDVAVVAICLDKKDKDVEPGMQEKNLDPSNYKISEK